MKSNQARAMEYIDNVYNFEKRSDNCRIPSKLVFVVQL